MKNKLLKVISITVGVLGGGLFLFRAELQGALKIPSRYYAKEYCSCVFVLEQDPDFCIREVKEFLPYRELKLDQRSREVTAVAFGHQARAKWISPRFGCVALPLL